jgi:glycosyltransferase involved in cell wall biosynthesis
LFVNSWVIPYLKVYAAAIILRNGKIVQRIDGSAQDYGRGTVWDYRQAKVNRIADLTIFQSKYGRYATREKFGVIRKDGPVIHNPVDTELFAPDGTRSSIPSSPRIGYVGFSTNPKKGVDQFYRVAKKNPDLEFILVGPFKQRSGFRNIHYTGYVNRHEVAGLLRNCHFFVFFSQNEACPNVVLEAMATGLPVLYLDSGGTRELVGEAGLAITTDTFRSALEEIRKDWAEWARRARSRATEKFSVEKIIPKYLSAMLDMQNK